MLSWLILPMMLSAVPAPDSASTLEVIQVTASRRSNRAVETIAPVSVVSEEQIRRLAPLVTADALRGQTGVFVQQTTPGQGIPIVRGLKGSEVLHLVDGVRFNNALFRNAPNQYLALLEPALLQAVEVVRGPASTLYGADAMGGVVQFVTIQPQFSPEPASRAALRATAGSADNSLGLSGWLEYATSNDAWRVTAGYRDVGDRETARETLVPSGYESRSINASWRHRSGNDSEIQLDVQHLRQPSTPRIDELVAGFGQQQAESEEFFFEPNQRDFVHLRWQGETASQWADRFSVHLAGQKIRDDRRSRSTGSTRRRLERNASTQWGLTAQFDRESGSGTDWVWGAELYHDRVDSSRTEQELSSGLSEVVASRFPDGSTQDSGALYLHGGRDFGPLRAEAGVRYSHLEVDLARTAEQPAARVKADRLTGSLGLRWTVDRDLFVLANLGQGFRAPNIFDLGTLGERPGNRFNVANAELSPEKLVSLDLGVKWLRAGWQGEVVAFIADYDDKIESVATGGLTDSGRVIVRSENRAEVRLTGIEIGLQRALTPNLDVGMNLTSVRGVETDGMGQRQPADRVPPLSGRLSASWLPAEHWRLDLSVLFARRQDRLSNRDLGDPRINPDGTPAWASADLRLGWQPDSQWQLGLRINNLANRAYREHGSGIDAPGRGVVLTVERTF